MPFPNSLTSDTIQGNAFEFFMRCNSDISFPTVFCFGFHCYLLFFNGANHLPFVFERQLFKYECFS